jgi:predicted GNAT family acetyltransferase
MTQPVGDEKIMVVDNEADRFYELTVDGASAGMLIYELSGTRRVFTHTFIAEGWRGRGLAGTLVRTVLDRIRAKPETITNFCGIVDGFIVAHPEYDVVIDKTHPGSWARHSG